MTTNAMTTIRRVAYLALVIGFAHTVFGAIVRITGSGLGCGNHWPDCNSRLLPGAGADATVIIEWTHRVLAALLLAAITALVALAIGASGGDRDGSDAATDRARAVRTPAAIALALGVTAAAIGAIIVKLDLSNRYLIAVHYGIAMLLLATLVVAVVRAGGLGAASITPGAASAKTWRGARIAVGLAFVVVLVGALTANVPGAAESCQGFPACRVVLERGVPLEIQVGHRVLAFLLFFHLFGLAIAVRKRAESPRLVLAAQLTFLVIVAQVLVAAALVELHLPAPLQSLHQATGTLVWVSVCAFAALARRGAGVAATRRVPLASTTAPRPATVA
jgi:heme A synthase